MIGRSHRYRWDFKSKVLTYINLKFFYRRWKALDDVSWAIKSRMLCEAKREAVANYFKSYGLIGGKEFWVDPLRRFVRYIDFDPEYYDFNDNQLRALVRKT